MVSGNVLGKCEASKSIIALGERCPNDAIELVNGRAYCGKHKASKAVLSANGAPTLAVAAKKYGAMRLPGTADYSLVSSNEFDDEFVQGVKRPDTTNKSKSKNASKSKSKAKSSSRRSVSQPSDIGLGTKTPPAGTNLDYQRGKEKEEEKEVEETVEGTIPSVLTLTYTTDEQEGARDYMEDYVTVHPNFELQSKHDTAICSLFVLSDGHGGHRAAEYFTKHFYQRFIARANKYNQKRALYQAYKCLSKEFEELTRADLLSDGGTLVVVLLHHGFGKAWVMNLGDSRAMLCAGGKTLESTVDHKPDSKAEFARIEARSREMFQRSKGKRQITVSKSRRGGAARINKQLAMSRAIGDYHQDDLSYAIDRNPDMFTWEIPDGQSTIVIASDGLWDNMKKSQVSDLVSQKHYTAQQLVDTAVRHPNNSDNVSAILVTITKHQTTDTNESSGKSRTKPAKPGMTKTSTPKAASAPPTSSMSMLQHIFNSWTT